MIRRNLQIREALKQSKMKQWELAECLGIAETTLCVKLRVELPEEEKQHILQIIKEKAGENNG